MRLSRFLGSLASRVLGLQTSPKAKETTTTVRDEVDKILGYIENRPKPPIGLTRRDFNQASASLTAGTMIPDVPIDPGLLETAKEVKEKVLPSINNPKFREFLFDEVISLVFNKKYGPKTEVFYPGDSTIPGETRSYERLTPPVSEMSLHFPLRDFKNLSGMISKLESSVSGENILPPGHRDDEDIPSPWAWGYPVNFEHVKNCPYCLGKWSQGWVTLSKEYEKLLDPFEEAVTSFLQVLPSIPNSEIVSGFFTGMEEGEKAEFHDSIIYRFTTSDYFRDNHDFDNVPNEDEMKMLVRNFIESTPRDEFNRVICERLTSGIELFKKWMEDLTPAINEVQSKGLPELLEQFRPKAIKQNEEEIQSKVDFIKSRIRNALKGKEDFKGTLLIFQFSFDIDDFKLIKEVLNEPDNETFKRNIRVVKIKEDHTSYDALYRALEYAYRNADRKDDNLAIAYQSNNSKCSHSTELQALYDYEIYLLHEVATYINLSKHQKIRFLIAPRHEFEEEGYDKNEKKTLAYSDFFIKWLNSLDEEMSPIHVSASIVIDDRISEAISKRYGDH